MELLADLWEFAQALYEQAQWVLTGSVIVVVVSWAWNKTYGKKAASRISYFLQLASILLFATFFAWRAEHRLAQDRPQFDVKEFHLTQQPLKVQNSDVVALTNYFQLQLVNTSERRYAKNISGELVVLGRDLDSTKPAVSYQAVGAVNPVGPKRELNVASRPAQLDYSTPLYVYTTLRYQDESTGETYDQVWYNKATGAQGGIFVTALFQVDKDEQRRMADCLSVILKRPVIAR